MTIAASAVSRVLGVDVKFKDLRGGSVLFLPQQIAIFAQGSTDATYSTDKWQATGAGPGGSRYGFGSMIHLILRELFPVNGDGVGTIPVWVYPLEDGGSAVAAAGDITPSGTATAAAAYKVRCSGIDSEPFVLPVGALTGAALHSALYKIKTAIDGVLEMPVDMTYTYGTVTASALVGTGNGTISLLSVTGTPIPGAYTLKVNTAVTNGGVWTLTDPNGVVISNAITQTVGVGAATAIDIGGIAFTLTDGTTDFALNATFTITVPATKVVATCKWKGETGNALYLEVLGEDVGLTFAITQPTGGLVNPSITAALAQVGSAWDSMCLNAMNADDTDTLDEFQEWGEGRWGETVKRPTIVFYGNTEADVTAATAITTTRRLDRITSQLVAPGSVNLPFVVAARELVRIAVMANDNPPTDYANQRATRIIPGTDGEQWDNILREIAVKAGSSTTEIKNGVVCLSDTITSYRPVGEEPPGYRYVCDIVKIQNVVFNLELLFAADEWAGAPLIPDDQPTVNPRARKPSSAIAQVAAMIDNLALWAILADAKAAKKTIRASINSSNPKRLDITFVAAISGNSNIIGVEFNFGFFFGTPALAA